MGSWVDTVERRDDMNIGFLRIHRQEDGDVCITGGGKNLSDQDVFASIEFCSIGSGGGRSPKTIEALRDLFNAMLEDSNA